MEIPSTSFPIIFAESCNNFPSDVFKWMKINAKPLMSLKLMQVCKYFQHRKFPYFVVKSMIHSNGHWRCSGSYNDELPSRPVLIIKGTKKFMETPPTDLNSLPDCSLWILDIIIVYNEGRFISELIPKLAVCQAREICLNMQILTLQEFQILTSCKTFERVQMHKTLITVVNDEPASFESILKCLPNVIHLFFETNVPSIASSTFEEIPVLLKLETFEANQLFESFDFNSFLIFIKAHPSVHFTIDFDFTAVLSPEYQQTIKNYIYKFLAEEPADKFPPKIDYHTDEPVEALVKLDARYREALFASCQSWFSDK